MISSAKYKALRFDGKVAVITAATKGIGFAIAERLGHEGAKVVISSRNDKNVQESVQNLVNLGLDSRNVCGCVCHVAKKEDQQLLLETTLNRFGRVDILVNNAGINPHFGDILDITESIWDKLFEVNVKAGFMLTKLFVPEMEKTGNGSIVFNASIGAYNSPVGIAAYGITKTAVLGLTKALATSLAQKKFRVNCIAPGIIKTSMSKALWEGADDEKVADSIGTALGRLGSPEECAAVVAFLCSDDANYITGETIVCAGGAISRL